MITALVAGLAATVRPTGYALLPVLILMVLMARRSLRDSVIVVLAAAVLPMVVMVSAERFYTTWIFGSDATSLAGRHLFAKAVLIKAPPMADAETDPMRRRLLVAAEQHFAPIRDLLDQAPDANVLSVLSTNYEMCLEYSCVADLRSAIGLPEAAMNRVALAVGLDRLTAAPLAYARLIWRNYRATWVLYSQNHPELAPGFTAFIAIHQPLPFAERMPSLADTQVSLQSFFVRPTMIAIGWLTGLLALAGLSAALWGERGSCPLLGTSLVAALALHGSLLWTAAVGVGISRYTIGLWPMIIGALMFAGLFVWRYSRREFCQVLHSCIRSNEALNRTLSDKAAQRRLAWSLIALLISEYHRKLASQDNYSDSIVRYECEQVGSFFHLQSHATA